MPVKNRPRCTRSFSSSLEIAEPGNGSLRAAVRAALLGGAVAALAVPVHAQEPAGAVEEVIVTGTRIRQPGVVSSSPIYSITSDEIRYQQEPELEKILRLLPITVDRKSTRLNSSHVKISYAVFCLKKKTLRKKKHKNKQE